LPQDPWAEPEDLPPSRPLVPRPENANEALQSVKDAESAAGLTAALASLPSSFSTFLLSILDSPAYSNLSTSYLNDVFNPATPDDPRVRYFSVAGRAPSVNIWHPFWLPKMVVDAWEADERARARERGARIAGIDSEWGNDGLVTVQSAKWGEFLGTIEGCDHWEIRGARGIELDIDIPSLQSVSISMPTASLHDWDWRHFLTAWRKDGETKSEQSAATEGGALGAKVDVVDAQGRHSGATAVASATATTSSDEMSASEKLSTVFDWVAANVPTEPITRVVSTAAGSIAGRANGGGDKPADVEAAAQGTNRRGERNELATKEDLERFYIALCRKLYDEGL
jgi:triacylglycerol lipase